MTSNLDILSNARLSVESIAEAMARIREAMRRIRDCLARAARPRAALPKF